jgi:flagellar hook-length control protein FliK
MPAAAAENRPAGAIDAPAALGGSRDPAAASLHAAPAEARRSPEPAVPLAALAVEVGMRAVKGAREFSISLDPDELGRVDVTLRIDDQGAVKAEVRVERVETLQLLQRDARTLERAFEQAGLRNGGDMLQFSLSGGERQGGGQSREDNRTRTRKSDTEAAEALSPGAIARYARPAAVGLDIHI